MPSTTQKFTSDRSYLLLFTDTLPSNAFDNPLLARRALPRCRNSAESAFHVELVSFRAGRDEENVVRDERDETELAGFFFLALFSDEIKAKGLLDVSVWEIQNGSWAGNNGGWEDVEAVAKNEDRLTGMVWCLVFVEGLWWSKAGSVH